MEWTERFPECSTKEFSKEAGVLDQLYVSLEEVKHRLLFVCLCVILLLSYIISCVCISVSLYYGLVAIIIRFRVLDQPLRFVRGAMKHRLLCVCLCVCYFCYRLLFLIFSLLSSSRICYHYYSYYSCHY